MKTLTKGYVYGAANHVPEKPPVNQKITFVRYEPKEEGSKELELVHNGTTNEEVLDILIDRMSHQNDKLSDKYSKEALAAIKSARKALEKRTKSRQKRGVAGTMKK